MLLNPKETGDREQGTSCPYLGHSPLPIPRRHGREEGTGQEEEENKDEEEEAGSEDKLTTLATWAVLGCFEWSRAKIVYSERKAGSAIIPAST